MGITEHKQQYIIDFGCATVNIDYMWAGSRTRRTVGRFVIFGSTPPTQAMYIARSIVISKGSKYNWLKNIDSFKVDEELTFEEEKALTIQMLKSEVW